MKLRDPRVWLAVLSCAGVLAIAAADMGKTLPGPLCAAHARVPELDQGQRCASCHGGWFSDLQHSCMECHGDIEAQVAESKGLHGSLGDPKAKNCGLCHSEHHGEDFALVNRASWTLAGVPDQAAFDHRRVGFAMDGRHLELACAQCHTHADEQPLAAGHRRFLGLQGGCASCHDDVHDGAMVVRCDQCHGQSSFLQPASLGHERYVPLTGGHGDVECATCHEPNSAHDVMRLGVSRARQPRGCQHCHESPHQPALVAAAMPAATPAGEVVAVQNACAVCHLAEHEAFAAARGSISREMHAAAGFPLTAPHADVECAKCHAVTGTFAARHPGRDADTCASCHADPHGGQFAGSPQAKRGCLSCHDRLQFEPHAFTAEMHDRTALPLRGRHAEVECASCHSKASDAAPRRFHGTKARCDDCHRDAHDGAFTGAHKELSAAPGGTCALCHDANSFSAASKKFDHGHFTRMPLDGAHAQAACEACHERTATPDATGRSFGRVRDRHGAFTGCASCHDDPHAGRFDQKGMPADVGGRRDCARCHDTASFRHFPRAFDHALWTGFPLHGAHATAQCSACHPPDAPGSAATVPPARGTRCGDCHEEPHAGQFALDGQTDCKRCHRASSTFKDLTFRHELDARFKLGEAHANVACAACHVPFEAAGQQVVRYRPVPRECVDCHGQQQDPLRREQRKQGGGR